MDLLEEIGEWGWDEHRAKEFERRYGEAIRWRIVVYMEKLRLIQWRIHPEHVDVLADRRLELFQDTHSDLWIELLNGLIPTYIRRKKEGKVHQEFLPYLSGVIKKLLIANAQELKLLGKETPYELLRGICEAKREKKNRIAWAKYRLWEEVWNEVLNRCSPDDFQRVYKNIHHVVDYFFEIFVPKRQNILRRSKRRPVAALVEALLAEELEEALGYAGKITPFAVGGEEERIEGDESNEEAFLSSLAREV